jgi:transposase
MQTLHRVRDQLVGERTALINQLCTIPLECGIFVPQGRNRLEWYLADMFGRNDEDRVCRRGCSFCSRTCEPNGPNWTARSTDSSGNWFFAREDEATLRLLSVPGIDVMNATALIAAIGRGEAFNRGRDLAAWLGPVPQQITTDGRPRLVGISKRGSKYLRKLLIHRAWAALPGLLTGATPLGGWLRGLMVRECIRTRLWSRRRTSWCKLPGLFCGEAARSMLEPR